MYLITKWFGTFLYEKKEIKDKILFPKDEKEIAKRLLKINKDEVLTEEKKISKNKKNIIVSEKRLEKIGTYKPTDTFFKEISLEPIDFNFSNDLLNKASLILTKNIVDIKLASEDLQIIQMVSSLDELIQTSNLLSERLNSWAEIPTPKSKIKPLETAYTTINKEIKSLEELIENDMKKIAPNITSLVGPLIGARLIAIAGSMQRLARLPASTIQILGAEKALFRYKKEGGNPPKHGVIFQHNLINKAQRQHRGKIARAFATKLSIAAKADVFTKRDISNNLLEKLKERINEIKNL